MWCISHQAQVSSNCWHTRCLFLDLVGETTGRRLIKLGLSNPWSLPLNSLVSTNESRCKERFWHSGNKSIYFFESTLLFQALRLGLGSLCSDLA